MSLNNRLRIYTNLLCLFCIGFPIFTRLGTWCLIALIAFWVVVGGLELKNRANWAKPCWPMLAFFLLHLLALTYTENISEGWTDIKSKAVFLIAPTILCTVPFTGQQIHRIARTFVIGTLLANILYLGYATFQFAFLDADYYIFNYSNLTDPLQSHPAYMASYNIFGIIYLLNDLFSKWRQKDKLVLGINIIAILFLWLLVILYISRMQVLAMCLILSIFFIWNFGKQKKWILALIFPILVWTCTFIAMSSFPMLEKRMNNALENINTPSNVRFELWDSGFNVAKQSPVFGVGPGDLKALLVQDYLKKDMPKLAEIQLNTHNQYLEAYAGIGILGLVSLLLIFIIPSLQAFKSQNLVILSFFAIIALGSLTECMLEVQRGSIWFGVFGSLFWKRENLTWSN